MTLLDKLLQLLVAVVVFAAVMGVVLLVADRARGRRTDLVSGIAFTAPAFLLLLVGLLYPAARTAVQSFLDARSAGFVGLANYVQIFTQPDLVVVLRNTLLWVVITPILATAIGLVYAVLVDRTRFEAFAKALIFLPMAISFVGAAIIWKFVYEYRPNQQNIQQIGLLNQFLVWLGFEPVNFILAEPWNNLLLIVVMIWIQAGFAMTVLSAAIKAIPSDIIEAARLDGVGGMRLFFYITLPSIRPAVVVVITAISIAVLKVFDIVRTMTGGQFDTSVVANEFYVQSFRLSNLGMGSALAMILFVLVVPIVIYNVRQMRKVDGR
ncbi:carbohydrate ABC transporter membrane protein 1 (CUT1 family) [Pseudonocardia hierapolitana]|uniref:Carbohydrate ABC transporter membrane protein 1 (CUT1 family) n=1 Tax=Pseudonocardia hierapolitana TaxID=1128676 RepID=A0A561SQF0_9PSEU|nr:sugar ABC transporter permease [Pseudonocardia hierapolitana]TWF77071.1 carbohydrate ABC transporter membrane protein 1 (CUT1 family) [Pseudonocardia hierapolitana]